MCVYVGQLTEAEEMTESLKASAQINYWRALRGLLSEEDEAIRDSATIMRVYYPSRGAIRCIPASEATNTAACLQCTVPARMQDAERKETARVKHFVFGQKPPHGKLAWIVKARADVMSYGKNGLNIYEAY